MISEYKYILTECWFIDCIFVEWEIIKFHFQFLVLTMSDSDKRLHGLETFGNFQKIYCRDAFQSDLILSYKKNNKKVLFAVNIQKFLIFIKYLFHLN